MASGNCSTWAGSRSTASAITEPGPNRKAITIRRNMASILQLPKDKHHDMFSNTVQNDKPRPKPGFVFFFGKQCFLAILAD